MSRGADHDVVAMRGAAAPPRRNGELVFEAPWQGRAFGLGVAICERGCYPWIDFQARLIDAIAANGSGEYYERWLEVLGRLLVEKGLVSEAELELRTRDFVSGARD